ncbi:ATP-binding cassette domain-containing protein [Tolypothrix bouteillei VB521301_2]|uniref:ATP-binding cassette domain-containing protein n=1 Tax=Tolypothrix bouteillei TaxID=1246981 RepID=UPI0038B475AB
MEAELNCKVVIGPNSAGKTTFLDVITGKMKPTEESFFKGKSLYSLSGTSNI